MVFILALLGAVLYRARGAGRWPGRPWWQILLAVPYAVAAFDVSNAAGAPDALALGVGGAVWALTAGAFLTGHASYIDLGHVRNGAADAPADGDSDEWYGAWIPWPGTYLHDLIGLAVSGLLVTMPAGLAAIAAGETARGAAIGLSGLLKAPAYAAGRLAPVADKMRVCEPLAGAAFWGALATMCWR